MADRGSFDAGVIDASVIASEAKQSKAVKWIASSLTLLAMTVVDGSGYTCWPPLMWISAPLT
jgi:hypothetical protein